MSIVNIHVASEVISALLCGAQLDTIRVYSLIIQLGFFRENGQEALPNEIWVSVSGSLVLKDPGCPLQDGTVAEDFFSLRGRILRETYSLIGKEVSAARVSEVNALQIDLGDKSLCAEPDNKGNLEVIWEVMSDTPDVSVHHRWHVSLDDAGVLSAHRPT
jgi:hypothetical protein